MARGNPSFVPALGRDWLTRLYDPLLRWTLREAAIKGQLLRLASLRPGHRVLDLGCGTATLTLMAQILQPGAKLVGLDLDQSVLRIAARKIAAARLPVSLVGGTATGLPHPDNCFDRVISCLFFHHLGRAQKVCALAEVRRVLRPGGEFHVADWGEPQNRLMRLAFYSVQCLDGFERTSDHVSGAWRQSLNAAGFARVEELSRHATIYGTLRIWLALKR